MPRRDCLDEIADKLHQQSRLVTSNSFDLQPFDLRPVRPSTPSTSDSFDLPNDQPKPKVGCCSIPRVIPRVNFLSTSSPRVSLASTSRQLRINLVNLVNLVSIESTSSQPGVNLVNLINHVNHVNLVNLSSTSSCQPCFNLTLLSQSTLRKIGSIKRLGLGLTIR